MLPTPASAVKTNTRAKHCQKPLSWRLHPTSRRKANTVQTEDGNNSSVCRAKDVTSYQALLHFNPSDKNCIEQQIGFIGLCTFVYLNYNLTEIDLSIDRVGVVVKISWSCNDTQEQNRLMQYDKRGLGLK